MITTITSKGQLTIPKKLRTLLNLHPGNRVEFIIDEDGTVKMIPIKSTIKELKGMTGKAEKTVTLEEMQSAIENRK